MSSIQYSELIGKGVPTAVLDKTNWEEWNALMTPFLQARGLDDLVESTTVAGVAGVNLKYKTAKDAAELVGATEEQKKAFGDIKRAAATVTLVLRATATPNIREEALHLTLPHEIWAVYEIACKPKQNVHWQEYSEAVLARQQLSAGESVASLIRRINAAGRLYKNAHGVDLSESRKSSILFSALKKCPEPWCGWSKVYENLSKSYADNCTAAKDHELKLFGVVADSVAGVASGSGAAYGLIAAPAVMAATATPSRGAFKRTCYFCHEEGHVKSDCPKLKKKKEEVRKAGKQKEHCGICGKTNHTTEKCWKNKKNKGSGKSESSDRDDDPFAGLCSMVFSIDDAFVGVANVDAKKMSWFLDSGASRHVVTNKNAMVNIRRLVEPVSVTVADGKKLRSEYEGEAFIRTDYGVRRLENVLLHESNTINIGLISVGTLDRKGVQLTIGGGVAIARRGSDTILRGDLVKNNMYHVVAESIKPSDCDGDSLFLSAELELWHKRLAHVNIAALKHMHDEGMVHGLVSERHDADKCEACMKAKAVRRPFGNQMKRNSATVRFERVHADVIGPFRVPGFKAARYALIMVDEATDYVFYYLLKYKSDVAASVKKWHALIKNQFNAVLKEFHSDYGGEFVSKDLLDYWASHGIMATQTTRNTPQHNSVVERKNRTIKDGVRASLIQANLPLYYWAVALAAFVHVINRSTRSVRRDVTPYESMHGVKPFVNHVRVFGCDAYVTVPDANGSTVVRGEPMVFVGYDEQRGGWIFYWPSRNIHTVSRDAVFQENKFTIGRSSADKKSERIDDQSKEAATAPDWLFSDENLFEDEAMIQVTGGVNKPVVAGNNHNINSDISSAVQGQPAVVPVYGVPTVAASVPAGVPALDDEVIIVKREQVDENSVIENSSSLVIDREEQVNNASSSTSVSVVASRSGPAHVPVNLSGDSVASRIRNKPAAATEFAPRHDEEYWNKKAKQYEKRKLAAASSGDNLLAVIVNNEKEPSNHDEVLKSSHKKEWLAAEKEEIKSQVENKSFIIIPLSGVPSGHRVLQSRWVYKLKRDVNNRIARFKARLVAKGYMQRHGIDYFDTFAPVMSYRTLRVILSLAAAFDMEIKQVDIVTAFLHADVKEDIYMELPDGYKKDGKVMKLKKAIYGIKQAPRAWNTLFNQVLISLGFKRLRSDACVYFDGFIIIGIFVDDVLILYALQNEDRWLSIKKQLFNRFKAKDLGDALFILGMRITRDRENRYIYLDQEAYLGRVIETFKIGSLSSHRGCNTPMIPNVRPITGDHLNDSDKPYRSAIGSLMYASVSTRPDIAYSVNALAQFNNEPKEVHWEAVLRIVKYLSNTVDYKLRLGGANIDVAIYTDADWAGDKSDAKSVSGGVTCLGEGTVDWLSRKQKTVALSSMEAEFNAAVPAVQNALWIKQLLFELNKPIVGAVSILEDNEAAIEYCKNGGDSHRTRHFNIKYKFVQDHVEQGNVVIDWIESKSQLADMLTKPLSVAPFCAFRDRLLSRIRS